MAGMSDEWKQRPAERDGWVKPREPEPHWFTKLPWPLALVVLLFVIYKAGSLFVQEFIRRFG